MQTVNRVTHQDDNKWVSLSADENAVKKSNEIFKQSNIDKDAFIIGIHPSFSALKKNKFRSQKIRMKEAGRKKTGQAWQVS